MQVEVVAKPSPCALRLCCRGLKGRTGATWADRSGRLEQDIKEEETKIRGMREGGLDMDLGFCNRHVFFGRGWFAVH